MFYVSAFYTNSKKKLTLDKLHKKVKSQPINLIFVSKFINNDIAVKAVIKIMINFLY